MICVWNHGRLTTSATMMSRKACERRPQDTSLPSTALALIEQLEAGVNCYPQATFVT